MKETPKSTRQPPLKFTVTTSLGAFGSDDAATAQNPPPNLGIKTDELAKSQKWDGKVKSSKCKACES
jgi:hypothetical protein